jgi:hypothetical protein
MGSSTATLKLYASLSEFLPPGSVKNEAEIKVGEADSVARVIERYYLPERLVHLVLIDGVYIEPEDRPIRILGPGEVLAIWPPVAGG